MLSNEDSANYYSQILYDFAEQTGNRTYMAAAMNIMAGAVWQRDLVASREFLIKGLRLAEEINDHENIKKCIFNIGNTYYYEGSFAVAFQYWKRALKMAEKYGDTKMQSIVTTVMGNLYRQIGNLERARFNYNSSVADYEEIKDSANLALALNNLAGVSLQLQDTAEAIAYFSRALSIAESTNLSIERATAHIGLASSYPPNSEQFEHHLLAAEQMTDSLDLRYKKLDVTQIKGYVALRKADYRAAIKECSHLLQLTEEIDALTFQVSACKCLYESYRKLGDGNKALEFHEKLLVLNDSLQAQRINEKLQRLDFEKELVADSLKQNQERLEVQIAHNAEVRKKNRQRNILLGSGILLLILAAGLISRLRFIRRSKAVLQKEKDRSENLLLNILPAEIAEELKAKGEATARNFDMVSIIFTDFKHFTQTSEKLSPDELVSELNYCFKGFDAIMEKYSIEKIKTIGDAYMAASGLPVSKKNSTRNAILAALEMQQYISDRKAQMDSIGRIGFEMRAGIHTGPVVAGIVGVKKFQYDIWGDTVNTASRVESSGQAGKVNISHETYLGIKDDASFIFEKRDSIEVKGKGPMDMYFVSKALAN